MSEAPITDTPIPKQNPPLFINRCTYTRAVFLEMQKVARPLWRRVLLIIINLLFIVIISAALLSGVYDLAAQMFSFLFLVLFLQLGVPRVRARQLMKRALALYDAPLQATTYFFDDHIFSHSAMSDAKVSVPYTKITRIFSTKKQYILKLDPQIYILLDKNGFTDGSSAAFEHFIREKVQNAKMQQ